MDAPNLDIWIEAQQPPIYEEIRAYEGGEGLGSVSDDGKLTGDLRLQAIKEAAFSLAAQTALAWRYDQLLDFTKSQEGTLDRIASFSPFVVDKHMLLPSITEVRDRFEVSPDDQKLRTVKVQYRVDEPPRAISSPPTWRDYLWREYPYPDDPHPKLLPRTMSEVGAWEGATDEGWKAGLEQAQFSWENNLNELVQDIRGRITYRILEAREIVDRPVMVGSVPEMTTDDGGKVINAGDTVYSVAVPLSFKSQNEWGALWVSTEEAKKAPVFNSGGYPGFSGSGIPDAQADTGLNISAEPVFGEK
ncbi:type IV secretory system conjugative DNA transfer family protein [Marinobacter salarius]|uniref:Type IV secretory system, conjugal DNA-protein transfer n=1 Tax=Marinobacter salarius TaxID=1420917 RepID=A0A1W6KFM6_9GAMM|nr:type IV secretory system conjugative DNA transfer family protein [Marinobacter salarius]ARM86201.1 type IV secretory system, conjugal DNA-protein transfer [Marinobacter salarius]